MAKPGFFSNLKVALKKLMPPTFYFGLQKCLMTADFCFYSGKNNLYFLYLLLKIATTLSPVTFLYISNHPEFLDPRESNLRLKSVMLGHPVDKHTCTKTIILIHSKKGGLVQ